MAYIGNLLIYPFGGGGGYQSLQGLYNTKDSPQKVSAQSVEKWLSS